MTEGGLNLISILEYTYAMVAKFMLRIVQDGDYNLQHILRAKIGLLSKRRWASNDFLWIVSPRHTLPIDESKLWSNFCIVWSRL